MINNLRIINNNIIQLLKKDSIYAIFVFFLFCISYCHTKSKIKIPDTIYTNMIAFVFIFYLSFFVPKYGMIFIVFYFYYKVKSLKTKYKNDILSLKNNKNKNKNKNKKEIKKNESYSNSYITEDYSSVSSCQVCKTFARKPATDKVAHFKNKKINDRIQQDANFRKNKQI